MLKGFCAFRQSIERLDAVHFVSLHHGGRKTYECQSSIDEGLMLAGKIADSEQFFSIVYEADPSAAFGEVEPSCSKRALLKLLTSDLFLPDYHSTCSEADPSGQR
ncbi:MAG: hypothetical protein HC779_08745 [Phyllobacteriaceae bacterium]|nr:hypothetical protein [Phyllobacteriaceae bacterium]